MTHRFTREELYDLVWKEPMRKVAANLGFSDVGLAKACRTANIPIPERGYWAKLQAGKKVEKRPLPIRPPGLRNEVEIGRERLSQSRVDDASIEFPTPPKFDEPISEAIERARKLLGRVSCAKNLESPHPAIARLLAEDERRRQKQVASSFPLSWDDPVFDSPFEKRRLRILSSILSALDRCGAKARAGGRDGRDIGALVGNTHVRFVLDSPSQCDNYDRRDSYRKPDPRQPVSALRFKLQSWWEKLGPGPEWTTRMM